MFTSWLWRRIRPKPLAVAVIVAVWAALLTLLWFLVYPLIGPFDLISPEGGPGVSN